MGHIRHVALRSPLLPKAPSLGPEKCKQAGKAAGKGTPCLTSDALKGQNHEGTEQACSSPKPAQALNLS